MREREKAIKYRAVLHLNLILLNDLLVKVGHILIFKKKLFSK